LDIIAQASGCHLACRGDGGWFAGAVVVIVKDGQVLRQRSYGYADISEHKLVDPSTTMFRPGSPISC
jgi:CubicO group peptidase (beta-lactamase class C family)